MSVTVVESSFGKLQNGEEVKKVTITNKNDFSLSVISFGAGIQSITVKDKNGQPTNVVLGFNTIEEYADLKLNPCFGATIGRVTNRISNAQFTLDGQTYTLDRNNGEHCLHSGVNGIHKKNWNTTPIENGVSFTYLSPDGEAGFPGTVNFETKYTLDAEENRITIEHYAKTDKATPIDLSTHTYFNLAGHDSGIKIYDHELELYSDSFLEYNPDCTLTGKINTVENNKHDFRGFKRLGDKIKTGGLWPEDGFDNFFVGMQTRSFFKQLATLRNPANGLRLEVLSNQNGVQFYTGNHLNITKPSNGQSYSIHNGLVLEAHNFTNAVNTPDFPSIIVNPGEEYYSMTAYTFSVEA